MTQTAKSNNMPLVYNQNNDENYPQITSMLRKTKRDDRCTGAASKRPALATISNIQNVNSNNNDLGKQIKQRQNNPFNIRVDTKRPSPKQKQLASRSQRCTSTGKFQNVSVRQSTLSSFRTCATSSTSSLPSSNRSNVSISSVLNSTCLNTSHKVSECPMSVERTGNHNMEVDDPSNLSNMSIDIPKEDPVRDIDADANKQFESPEYAEDIDAHLRKMEELYKPRADYMNKQKFITYHHRSTVVDWMYEVYDEFHLNRKTFQLAVSYLDRFLSKLSIGRSNLQLLGTTALFLACKVEETQPPVAANFVYITDDTYTMSQLLKMESLILKRFGFEMNSTLTESFETRFLKASEADCRETYLTQYLCDNALVHGEKFLKYNPSMLAASAVCLSRATLRPDQPTWTPTLAHYTKYELSELKECIADLLTLQQNTYKTEKKSFEAVWNKYSLPRFMMIVRTKPLSAPPTI